ADEAGLGGVVRFHQHDGVGHREGPVDLVLDGRPGVEAAPAGHGAPHGAPVPAAVAVGPGQVEDGAAGGAGAHGQLLPGGGGEETAGVVVAGLGQEAGNLSEHLNHLPARGTRISRPVVGFGARSSPAPHPRRNTRALVVTGIPEVTRQTSAPGTWAVDVPRIWRTPSTTW